MEVVSYLVSQWPRRLVRSLPSLTYWECGFEFQKSHGFLSVLSVVCGQVKVMATGRSLVQRSPVECDRDASIRKRTWPTRVCCFPGGGGDPSLTQIQMSNVWMKNEILIRYYVKGSGHIQIRGNVSAFFF